LVRRVPPDGSRRQMGDCLIRAIADRLNAEVLTRDAGFPA
jgi:predicted nucleic acid-binding protein